MSLRLTPEYSDVARLNECILKKLEGLQSFFEKEPDLSVEDQEILRGVREVFLHHTEISKLLDQV